MIDDAFTDQIFSSRYLCLKYILQTVSKYINKSKVENYSLLFKLLALMPTEFFSENVTY